MALSILIFGLLWSLAGCTTTTTTPKPDRAGQINEVFCQTVPSPVPNGPDDVLWFFEGWFCRGVGGYRMVVYWKDSDLGDWTEFNVKQDRLCNKRIGYSRFSGVDKRGNASTRVFAVALTTRQGALLDFPCVDGTINAGGTGTWTAPNGPVQGLTCHLTGLNPVTHPPGDNDDSWSRIDTLATGQWSIEPFTDCDINSGQVISDGTCGGTSTTTTTVASTTTTTTTTTTVSVTVTGTIVTTTTTGNGTSGNATTSTTTTTGAATTTTTTTTTGGGSTTTTSTTLTGTGANTTTTTTTVCDVPFTYDFRVVGVSEDPTSLLKAVQEELAERFGQPVWCVSIEPVPAAEATASESRLLVEQPSRRLQATPVDGIWYYQGVVGVPEDMTDEEVAEVFRSLQFQDFVCQGLHEDRCRVVAVRVVQTHIHFDILVFNGMFSTTTTEMPWGMPWWAWFLICCFSALLMALCCLPCAGGAAGAAHSAGAKEPLRGTYHSLDHPDEGAEDGGVLTDDAEGSIEANEGL